MDKVFIYSADRPVNVVNRNAIKQLIVSLFHNERHALERINYIFCSDEYLLRINKEYLNHTTLTDVITFSLSPANQPVSAEVYMSTDRIKENAKSFRAKYQNELLRVMIHGALHLCGYTDKTKVAQAQMREMENHYLKEISFT